MTYTRLMRESFVAILVGLVCLVLGYMIGRQGPLPTSGVNAVSAEQVIRSSNGF